MQRASQTFSLSPRVSPVKCGATEAQQQQLNLYICRGERGEEDDDDGDEEEGLSFARVHATTCFTFETRARVTAHGSGSHCCLGWMVL